MLRFYVYRTVMNDCFLFEISNPISLSVWILDYKQVNVIPLYLCFIIWEERQWHFALLIYSVFKILTCCLTLMLWIFSLDALKNLWALCWYFLFSIFSFLFNLTYDCFSLFLLRVSFLAYHVCLFSTFFFWNISSY